MTLEEKAEEYVESRGKELFREFYDKQLSMADLLKKCCIEFATKVIKELEQKLEPTEKDLADYQFNYPTIKELEKENAELKEQIKKMKCWCNCGNYRDCLFRRAEEGKELKAEECHNCTNWELKEIEK